MRLEEDDYLLDSATRSSDVSRRSKHAPWNSVVDQPRGGGYDLQTQAGYDVIQRHPLHCQIRQEKTPIFVPPLYHSVLTYKCLLYIMVVLHI